MSALDALARACFRTPADQERQRRMSVESAQRLDEYDTYTRRWFILAANALTYFFWNLSANRHVSVISEFALFYGTTNEFDGFTIDTLGIDSISLVGAIALVISYPVCGALVDKYGLGTMAFASVLLALSSGWWWFLADDNFGLALASRFTTSFAGALNACNLLRVSNNWFPVNERALAVAVVAIVANLGLGGGLLWGAAFVDGDAVVNGDLLSCDQDFILDLNGTDIDDFVDGVLECSSEAEEDFCCVAPIKMKELNLSIAVVLTIVAIFSCAVVRDAPEKPPSVAGSKTKCVGVWESVKTMFKHRNYNQLCLADFLATGPIFVIFATVDRIFPPTVSDYAIVAAAAAIVVSIPASIIFSRYLAKTQKFYEFTAMGYIGGAACFLGITLFIFLDQEPTDYLILVLAMVALVFGVLWTVSVYELKIEYVYPGFAVQGAVVAVDRTIINFSTFVFLLAIPPERFDGDRVDGRQFTFLIGSICVVLGACLAVFGRNKRKYLRKEFEEEHGIENTENDFNLDEEVKDKNEIKASADADEE